MGVVDEREKSNTKGIMTTERRAGNDKQENLSQLMPRGEVGMRRGAVCGTVGVIFQERQLMYKAVLNAQLANGEHKFRTIIVFIIFTLQIISMYFSRLFKMVC